MVSTCTGRAAAHATLPFQPFMPRHLSLFAVFVSLALHVVVLAWAMGGFQRAAPLPKPEGKRTVVLLSLPKSPPQAVAQRPKPPVAPLAITPATPSALSAVPVKPAPITAVPPVPPQAPRATMAAPPAPSAEEWAFAAAYTLKNSKAYRYTWGQQVRSMMGTVVEGPDQGVVRFRIEIAPDGTLAQLQTLWTTSAVAERLARQAIQHMPALPPTPTGQPLVFEKTISFSPFASDGPPLYKDDCLPDPPAFRNLFVWDGQSPQMSSRPVPSTPPDPQALADCQRQLPKDSIEAESAHDQRWMDQWGSGRRLP